MNRAVLAVLLAVLVSGCSFGGADPTAKPSYDPVPDDELFAQVEDLPGVVSADLEWVDTFANPLIYTGSVRVTRKTDVAAFIDRMCAILWQGRPDASVVVDVEYGDRTTSTTGYRLQSRYDLRERYGPQPGTGQPPADVSPLPEAPGQP